MAHIDKDQIPLPQIEFTPVAKKQIELILKNDYTVKDKVLRLLISGKGCDGFDYSLGFTETKENDLHIPLNGTSFSIVMDPFTAYYLSQAQVDFVQDLEHHNEGFIITNLNQTEYSGKFWKKAPEKTPPLALSNKS